MIAVLWALVWRALVVALLPLALPSQAEIGAAQGDSRRLMVGLVAGLAVVNLLGLPLGIWRRAGLLGSLNRVVGGAVLVRLAFFGPIELMMVAWMAALAVAVVDWLYAVRSEQKVQRSGRRSPFDAAGASPFVPAPVSGPAPAPTAAMRGSSPTVSAPPYVPPPPWPNRSAPSPHQFGRPVMAWFVALIALLGIAMLTWVSHADLNPQSTAPPPAVPATSQPQAPATSQPQAPAVDQPQAGPPAAEPSEEQSGRRTLLCAELGQSSVCVRSPITRAVGEGQGG